MESEKQVEKILGELVVPGTGRSILQLNMVQGIEYKNGQVKLTLAATALNPHAQEVLTREAKEALKGLSRLSKVVVEYVPAKASELNRIDRVIAVMSGKGGVGKSLMAGLIAVALRRHGYQVGLLDADLTGPSIPKMFGISARPRGSDTGILPVSSALGIETISINLLLRDEGKAVIWRGPLIGKAIIQFWQDVVWGKLDFLIIDLPPGTADAPLTVMQSIPLDGIVIVFTPQDLTTMIVKKSIDMARTMKKHILGVVENMCYLRIAETGKLIEPFGPSKAKEMAQLAQAPILARLPIDPQLAKLCDEGSIELYDDEIVDSLGRSVLKSIKSEVH